MTDLKQLLDEAAQAAVEASGPTLNYKGTATDIVLAERVKGPWQPNAATPRALIEAVAAARKDPAVIAQLHANKVHLRDQVRNAKIRIDAENEQRGTSLSYPSWVATYLEGNSID